MSRKEPITFVLSVRLPACITVKFDIGDLYRVEQRKRMFSKWLVLGKGGVDVVGREPADSSDNAVSVAMVHCRRAVC